MTPRTSIPASSVAPSGAARAYRLPFPDDEHACHPSRRVQFAKLAKNALPPAPPGSLSVYAQRQSLSNVSPSKWTSPKAKQSNNYTGTSSSSATKARKPTQRIANPCDTDLWGFPVYFSPTREVRAQWELAAQNVHVNSLQHQRSKKTVEAVADVATTGSEDLERRRDYVQYLYLAAKYGPLDTVLYCCTSLPGHVYALLVEQSARKLQLWSKERVKALRNYWIARLSREWSAQSLTLGTQAVLQSLEHQQRAVTFLRQLQWHFVTKALRNWFEYTQVQLEVKWRFNFVAGQDLRARFQRWKEHVDAVKTFKKHLKSVAKRKRMAGVFSKWQSWKAQQEQVQQLFVRRWMKTQRDCFATWRIHMKNKKHATRAAITTQRHWRGFRDRVKHQRQRHAGQLLVRVARSWQARRRVQDLRDLMTVGQTLLQLTRLIAWRESCDTLQTARASILSREIERASEEAACASSTEEEAAAFVRAELDKVVRNQMHQRLQEKLKWLSKSGEVPEGVRSNREKLIYFATEKLVEEVQRETASRVISQFCALKPENAPLDDCLVCRAASTILGDDSEMRKIAQLGSAHVCSQFFCGKDTLRFIAVKLEALRDQEAAYEQELWLKALPTSVLWGALHLV